MTSLTVRKVLLAMLGLATGSLCFWLAARGVDLHRARIILESSDYRWILLGMVLFGIDLLVRTARWRVIISHRYDVKYFRLARALIVGYAVNILLPARLGELFRADYSARLTNLSRSVMFGSIFIERLVDLAAVMIIFCIGVVSINVQNTAIDRVMSIGLVGCFAGILLTLLIVLCKDRAHLRALISRLLSKCLPQRMAHRLLGMIGDFSKAIDIVRTRRFALVLAITLPIWVCEAASTWSICRAVGFAPSIVALMTLLGAASLSTLFPTAPGFVGSYQFAYVVVLRIFNISDTLALVAASAVQIFLMGSYAVLGILVWVFAPTRPWSTPAEATASVSVEATGR